MIYKIRELDKNYLGVVDNKSEFVVFTKIDEAIKDRLVLQFLTATRNGDGLLYLIDELKKKAPDDKIYIRLGAILVIPPVMRNKIIEEELLTFIT